VLLEDLDAPQPVLPQNRGFGTISVHSSRSIVAQTPANSSPKRILGRTLTKIKRLDLVGAKVTEAGLDDLKKALPNVVISQ